MNKGFILPKNKSDFMLSKENKATIAGIVVLLILAFVLNLGFKLSFGWSVFLAAVIGVVVGLITYFLVK
ncbi:MAG: hypothetical protein QXO57_03675 [Candidatus Aenigmatarchaeota archaeon]|nr:hypothetical protein [Candidatus Aenigmarchaeota archaeon]